MMSRFDHMQYVPQAAGAAQAAGCRPPGSFQRSDRSNWRSRAGSEVFAFLATALVAFSVAAAPAQTTCGPVAALDPVFTDGWGLGAANQRLQTRTTISRANVQRLTLKWAVSLGRPADHHSMPLVAGDTVFVGTYDGTLLALDRASGCERYVRQYDSDIRTAIIHGRAGIRGKTTDLLYFGTGTGRVYAVRASDGDVVWRVAADVHPHTRITGTPTLAGNTVYVPVSSFEAAAAAAPTYSCCTFRGSILALDAATGERHWRSYSIEEPAQITGSRLLVIKTRGPSGAPIWSAPAIDRDAGLLYYGTGENYSLPATDTSDAIVAIRLKDGSRAWHRQFTANDVWNLSCEMPLLAANCPDGDGGVDLDFGAPPVLAQSAKHGLVLLAGQKSGGVYALNPANGTPLWQRSVGRGGKLGGIHWGLAVQPAMRLLVVPVSDRFADNSADAAAPGLHAFDLDTGDPRWSTPHADGCLADADCDSGISAAIMLTPELAFAGALDGWVRAYDLETGEVLWSFQTAQEIGSTDGGVVTGGAIDVHGPVIAGDMLYVTSGYGAFMQKSGNAFLAFQLEENTL